MTTTADYEHRVAPQSHTAPDAEVHPRVLRVEPAQSSKVRVVIAKQFRTA